MTAPPLTSHFSTNAYRERDRFEAWRNRDWPSLAPVLDITPGPGPFAARSQTSAFDGLSIMQSRLTAASYDRSPARIRDGLDDFAMLVMLNGAQSGETACRGTHCGAGGVLIGDLSRPHRWTSSASRSITIAIPRAAAEAVLPGLASLHGTSWSAEHARPLFDQVRSHAVHLPRFDHGDGQALAASIMHIIAIMAGKDAVRLEPSAARAKAAQVRALDVIEARLHDCAFGPPQLAAELGLSRSALYRLFDREGGVAAVIRTRRVARLAALLADADDYRRIAEKSFVAGFADPAAAARAFRDDRGCSARDWRAAALESAIAGH